MKRRRLISPGFIYASEPAAFGLLKLLASATSHWISFRKLDINGPVQEFFKSAMNNVAVAK
jgi:hypothetical protein